MALDESDFVDRDFESARAAASGTSPPPAAGTGRAPTREELDSQLTATQQQLTKLREAQEQLERARAAVEELRRRRAEFQTGREEMRQHLTRGIGLLEKAEFEARRDGEQMAKSLEGLRTALQNVDALNDQAWTEETWDRELSKALVTIENARMEWNGARLKWPVMDSSPDGKTPGSQAASEAPAPALARLPLSQLCRIGFALTWPLAIVALIALALFAVLLFRGSRL
jgi:hypothetical protein